MDTDVKEIKYVYAISSCADPFSIKFDHIGHRHRIVKKTKLRIYVNYLSEWDNPAYDDGRTFVIDRSEFERTIRLR